MLEFTDEQAARLLEQNLLGTDPRESYALLWPSDEAAPVPYGVFLSAYAALAVRWLRHTGSNVRATKDADAEEAGDERRDIRRGLKEAFDEVRGLDELTEDQARKYQALTKLAGAHAAMCRDKRDDDEVGLKVAQAMHNLTASNAERDRD